jgi:tol-pal system protein YbgF
MKFIGAVVLVCLAGGCVTKAEFQPYQESVQDLEVETKRIGKRLAEIQGDLDQSLGTTRTGQADIKADLIDMRTEIQALRGELTSTLREREITGQQRQSMEETISLQLSYLQQKMENAEARLTRIEKYFGLKPLPGLQEAPKPVTPESSPPAYTPPGGGEAEPAAAPAAPPPAAAPPMKELSAEEAYDMAYHLFKSNENEAARKAFEQFIVRYPGSPLVANAVFWLGETHYREGQYEKAVLQYQKVVKEYPQGSKGADALLKMGYALEKMNEPAAAIAAMEKLLKAYPKAPQAGLAARKIEQLKAAPAGTKKE